MRESIEKQNMLVVIDLFKTEVNCNFNSYVGYHVIIIDVMMRNRIYVNFEIFPSAIIVILILMKVIKEATTTYIIARYMYRHFYVQNHTQAAAFEHIRFIQ